MSDNLMIWYLIFTSNSYLKTITSQHWFPSGLDVYFVCHVIFHIFNYNQRSASEDEVELSKQSSRRKFCMAR